MGTCGTFISEAYRDGQTFYFEACYSPLSWSASVWDAKGTPHGFIRCGPGPASLEGDALEDAVCEWVHRAVQHEVGLFIGAGCGPAVLPAATAGCAAANADHYQDRPAKSARKAWLHDAGMQELHRRSAELREQSRRAVARFQEVSGRMVRAPTR